MQTHFFRTILEKGKNNSSTGFCSREAKNKFWQCDWSAKRIRREKVGSVPILFYCSRERIRLVENGLYT